MARLNRATELHWHGPGINAVEVLSVTGWKASLVALTCALSGCGPQGEPTSDAGIEAAATTRVEDAAPSASFAQSPGCLEQVVSTVCGRTVRCSKTGEDKLLLRDDKAIGPAEDPCLRALSDLRTELRRIDEQPFRHGFPESDPFSRARAGQCARPELTEVQRAYGEVLAQVKREGIARVSTWEGEQRVYWTTLLQERFDFTEIAASCRSEEGAFWLKVQSDVGAPGSIPYGAVWRVGAPAAPVALSEVSDQSPAVIWSAGDLDGDGLEELIARAPLTSAEGEPRGARYELLNVTRSEGLVLVAKSDAEERTEGSAPMVYAVPLGQGRGLMIEGRLLVYADHAVTDAPAGALGELRAAEEAARREVRKILVRLDEGIPAPARAATPSKEEAHREGCEDRDRLGWTLALSRDLVKVGAADGPGAIARAAALTGLSGCLEHTEISVSP